VALDDDALMVHFTTVLTTSVVHDVREAGRAIGRELTAADVEPLTWEYYEAGLQNQAVQYLEALNALHAWTRTCASWWTPSDEGGDGFDLLLTPTLAEPPPRIGDVVGTAEDPWHGAARATAFACYTAPFNVTGQPGVSVPLAWEASENLPIGTQLVAASGREDVLLRVAAQLEAARPWADRRPVVHG
jgi:amidase